MKALKVIKKAVKWYLEKSSKNYIWMSSGMIPPITYS